VKKLKDKNWHDHCRVATQGIKFQCQRCCKCCYAEVTLSYHDIENILRANEKLKWAIVPTKSPRYPEYGNLEPYTIIHTFDPNEKHNGDMGLCAFLENETCKVYSGRPITCQTYPFSVELKKKMKDKRKLPKHAPAFLDIDGSKAYVVVFDPECPGIGKGSEVNLEQIAKLELENIAKVAETYKTELKNKIQDLVYPQEMRDRHAAYESEMKALTISTKVMANNCERDLFAHIAFNPKDVSEEDAKKLSDHTIGMWKKTFLEIDQVIMYYSFTVKENFGLIKVYVGTQPLSNESVSPEMIENVFSTLMVSEELRKKSKTSIGFANVKFEDGKWLTP
jgi:Fe-S-cluster containining protein